MSFRAEREAARVPTRWADEESPSSRSRAPRPGGMTAAAITQLRLCPLQFSRSTTHRGVLPPPASERLLPRPHLRESRGLVEPTVLHHVVDTRCVANVRQRVPVEHL